MDPNGRSLSHRAKATLLIIILYPCVTTGRPKARRADMHPFHTSINTYTTMTKYTKLNLSADLATDPRIQVTSSFFGLSQKATYLPTHSPLKAVRLEFSSEAGQALAQALKADPTKRAAKLSALHWVSPSDFGNYQLEGCYTQDGTFAALRLYQFESLSYRAISELCLFEGPEVAEVTKVLGAA